MDYYKEIFPLLKVLEYTRDYFILCELISVNFVHIPCALAICLAILQIVVSIWQALAPANFWDELIGLDFYGQCHLFSYVYNSNFICVSKYVSFQP